MENATHEIPKSCEIHDVTVSVACPTCNALHDDIKMTEQFDGSWNIPASQAFVSCLDCYCDFEITPKLTGYAQAQPDPKITPLDRFLADVKLELRRAQKLYPMTGEPIKGNPTAAAAGEEAGELLKAMLHIREGKSDGWIEVYQEALQLAVMAARCALEGDDTLGVYPDGHQGTGEIGEVFLESTLDSTSDNGLLARDAAVILSLALQYGAPIDVMTGAISRTKSENGEPQTIIGTVLDALSDHGPMVEKQVAS